ncbi:dihydrofolate reductase family protein [Luethyella okanaganae]|uniref:Dihydrofolate reductase family protein n=1 Tax=Luethyella okanaganae TaxID=69372 RepID=A0ABW1VHM7_9MICO
MGFGGATLATQLLRARLLDELLLFTHPVILGEGRPLLDEHDEPVELDLIEHRSFDELGICLGQVACADDGIGAVPAYDPRPTLMRASRSARPHE